MYCEGKLGIWFVPIRKGTKPHRVTQTPPWCINEGGNEVGFRRARTFLEHHYLNILFLGELGGSRQPFLGHF